MLLHLIAVVFFCPSLGHGQMQHMQPMNPPGHAGFQELPVYGSGPEAELRKELDKQTGSGNLVAPLPPDTGYIRPYMGSSKDFKKCEDTSIMTVTVLEQIQHSLKNIGNNWLLNFLGKVWLHASCVEIEWTGICTLIAVISVVMCGILPAILLPIETGSALHQPGRAVA